MVDYERWASYSPLCQNIAIRSRAACFDSLGFRYVWKYGVWVNDEPIHIGSLADFIKRQRGSILKHDEKLATPETYTCGFFPELHKSSRKPDEPPCECASYKTCEECKRGGVIVLE